MLRRDVDTPEGKRRIFYALGDSDTFMSSRGSAYEIALLKEYELHCFHTHASAHGFEGVYNDMWSEKAAAAWATMSSRPPMLDRRLLSSAYFRCCSRLSFSIACGS